MAQTDFDIGGSGFEYGNATFVNGAFPKPPAENDVLFVLLASTASSDADIGTPPTISSPNLVWTLEANLSLGLGELMLTVWSAVVGAGFALPEHVTFGHGAGSGLHDYFNTLLIHGADLTASPVVQATTLVVDPAAPSASIDLAPFTAPENIALVVVTTESLDPAGADGLSGTTSPNLRDTNVQGWKTAPAPTDDYYGPAGFYTQGEVRLPALFAAASTRWLLAAFEIAMVQI